MKTKKIFLLLTLFLVGLLFSCKDNNEPQVIKKDFSVTAKAENEGNTLVGKAIRIGFTVSGLDRNNKDAIRTYFGLKSSNGIFKFADKFYNAGDYVDFDYHKEKTIWVDYTPQSEGKNIVYFDAKTNAVTRSDTVIINATSPALSAKVEGIAAAVTVNVPMTFNLVVESEDEISTTAKFLTGKGTVLIAGSPLSENPISLKNGVNVITFTPSATGKNQIEFTLKGKYGKPQTVLAVVDVNSPEWNFTIPEGATLEFGKDFSTNLIISQVSETENTYTGTYRFVKGKGNVSINGVSINAANAFELKKGVNILIFNPSQVDENIIEFVVKDKYGKELKKEVVFYVNKNSNPIVASLDNPSQNAVIGDETFFVLSVSEEDYTGTFNLSYEITGGGTLSINNNQDFPAGKHRFSFISKSVGVNTFIIKIKDKNNQVKEVVGTVIASASPLNLTSNITSGNVKFGQKLNIVLTAHEKNYNGTINLQYKFLSGSAIIKINDIVLGENSPISTRIGNTTVEYTSNNIGDSHIEFTATDDRGQIAKANIKVNSYIEIIATADDGGTATGTKTINVPNTNHTVSAKPNDGYKFVGWFEDEVKIFNDLVYSFPATMNRRLVAKFEKIKYEVIVNASAGGAVSGSGIYDSGQIVKLTAKEEAEYKFIGWYENGNLLSTEYTYTFKILSNRKIFAKFERNIVNYTVDGVNKTIVINGVINYIFTEKREWHRDTNGGVKRGYSKYKLELLGSSIVQEKRKWQEKVQMGTLHTTYHYVEYEIRIEQNNASIKGILTESKEY